MRCDSTNQLSRAAITNRDNTSHSSRFTLDSRSIHGGAALAGVARNVVRRSIGVPELCFPICFIGGLGDCLYLVTAVVYAETKQYVSAADLDVEI